MEIKTTLASQLKPKPADMSKVAFGSVFTDHMFVMDYHNDRGWHDARIVPFGPLDISPAATVYHYATEIFEGLKAYRRPDGEVQLFRPIENVRRMNNSAERLVLPAMDEEVALEAMKRLVSLEKDWVPSSPGASLYVRPFEMAVDPDLALHGSNHCMYVIILSPVGSYYKGGLKPVNIMIENQDVRAVRGGTGYAKCGGNYAAATRASVKAEKLGYSQVIWLDGVERKYIEEVGGMNVMFKIGGKVITPALTGSVLPGITRKSILEMLKARGVPCEERLFSVAELAEAVKSGAMEECWCCGTAAVVSPIGELCYEGVEYKINNGEIGAFTQKLYDDLTGIQWGTAPDPFGWTVRVD